MDYNCHNAVVSEPTLQQLFEVTFLSANSTQLQSLLSHCLIAS